MKRKRTDAVLSPERQRGGKTCVSFFCPMKTWHTRDVLGRGLHKPVGAKKNRNNKETVSGTSIPKLFTLVHELVLLN
jgi:hypothetical protein